MESDNTELDRSQLVGTDLLGLVTAGINTNPLTLYREYIQNAADATEQLTDPEKQVVEIFVDVTNRNLTIRDKGPGLSFQQAKDALIPVCAK